MADHENKGGKVVRDTGLKEHVLPSMFALNGMEVSGADPSACQSVQNHISALEKNPGVTGGEGTALRERVDAQRQEQIGELQNRTQNVCGPSFKI